MHLMELAQARPAISPHPSIPWDTHFCGSRCLAAQFKVLLHRACSERVNHAPQQLSPPPPRIRRCPAPRPHLFKGRYHTLGLDEDMCSSSSTTTLYRTSKLLPGLVSFTLITE